MRFEYILNILLRNTLHRYALLYTCVCNGHFHNHVSMKSVKMGPPELYLVNQITTADSQSQPASPDPFSSPPSSPVPHAPVAAA